MVNDIGKIVEKVIMKKCFENMICLFKVYVKEFIIEYSDNGDFWR